MIAKTPLLQQYFQAKDQNPGVLMAMRVGDFYEFYGDDAVTAAEVLQITLTAREDGENGKVAMAGVPHHSVERYLARLLKAGQRVALCDQVEDPKAAKGLVKRAVTRVLTPGTLLEDTMLNAATNVYLTALSKLGTDYGVATLDVSTGEFVVTSVRSADEIISELARLRPSEILVPEELAELGKAVRETLGLVNTEWSMQDPNRSAARLKQQLKAHELSGFGLGEDGAALIAAAMLLAYSEQNRLNLAHVDAIRTYSVHEFMSIDPATRRSLELTTNLTDGGRTFTLLSVIDQTVNNMGARLLRKWIEQPLLDIERIMERQTAVTSLMRSTLLRSDLRDAVKRIGDLERLVSRCATGIASPRDLAAIRTSLEGLPAIHTALAKLAEGRLQTLLGQVDLHSDLSDALSRSIFPEPPATLREGGVISSGFDSELDRLRELGRDGRSYIARIEASERAETGIQSLKIGFNNVFGYYLEVSKNYSDKVPAHYVRKQTTANTERYITADLKEQESAILTANERAIQIESEIFARIVALVASCSAGLLRTAQAISELDVLASFAQQATEARYCRPDLVEENLLAIKAGRHPVVETATEQFVPNDVALDAEARLVVLTGPNMSGKSTYLRQTALIVILAQIGSYVPAKSCEMGICDRVFARIGAKDEIALGRSTFLVEMVESAFILNHATDRSLVVLDEVGRGTSTYDGLAIAWSMLEYMSSVECKTLFATHYHQLNALESQLPNVKNFQVSVREIGNDIVWTHKVVRGGTDRSYGIHVARKAGIPAPVLARASEILTQLEDTDNPVAIQRSTQKLQLSLFEAEDPWIIAELKQIDVNQLTPIEALTLLSAFKERIKNPG